MCGGTRRPREEPVAGRARAPTIPFRPGDWCIGNTAVSKTATPGSIPGSPALAWPRKAGVFGFIEPIAEFWVGWRRSASIRWNPLEWIPFYP
jgi:hypothetical protein